ncbi:MAG: hypothetical protein GKR89_36020 [Candidatus Latescibacteria bacterium]|nr:hypothetical protein [Candidatus Latescibacterota bacterium]
MRSAYFSGNALVQAAWQLFDDRWLNIPVRPLQQALDGSAIEVASREEGVAGVVQAIGTLDVQGAGDRTLAYLQAGHDGAPLMEAMGRAILWDDTGSLLLPTLRTVFDEWEQLESSQHPARFQLLVGLARYATDVRTNTDSGSAAITAMRFAEGRTTVEVFED